MKNASIIKNAEIIDADFEEKVPYHSLVEIILHKGIRINKCKNIRQIYIIDNRVLEKYNKQHKLTGTFEECYEGDEEELGKGCIICKTKDGYTFEATFNEIEDYKILKRAIRRAA